MKTFVSIIVSLLVAYLTLAWVVSHLGAVSGAACSAEFTLPSIACHIAGFGVSLLLVPLSGIVAFMTTQMVFPK